MSLFITALNSGSNGNCYYVGTHTEAVLIDAGISCREIIKRLKRLDLSITNVKAIFISHEHGDHIRGLEVLSKNHQIPVYITEQTEKHSSLKIQTDLVRRFKDDDLIQIGDIAVKAFKKQHDAADPHSFIVSSKFVNIGVITDIGIACKNVTDHFKQCHAVFLESNYDKDMLMNGTYPYHLKKRISDGSGHISNTQAFELFTNHRSQFLSHLILSHLSANNNDPEIVNTLFSEAVKDLKIVVASRHYETPVYQIFPGRTKADSRLKTYPAKHIQLSLF